tara:strand:- start:644 stop:1903 length:1260 start_codon:yes stop_codon:yes gene_type:complete
MNQFDIIIVGGGIAGLYCAYNLQDKFKILLLDKSNKLGGRIYTKTINVNGIQYNLETGAGRVSDIQKNTMGLIDELGLSDNLVKLPTKKKFISTKNIKYSYNTDDIFKEIIKISKKYKKIDLVNITFQKFVFSILKKKKATYIYESFGYKSEFLTLNAYDAIKSFKTDLFYKNNYFGFKNGYSSIVEKLKDKLYNTNIQLNTKFTSYIKNNSKLIVSCKADKKIIKYSTDKLIFALPSKQLISIAYRLFNSKRVNKLLHSVKPEPLCRIYAIYEKNPHTGKVWFDNLGKITTDNEIQYIIPINKETGLIMISYTDNIYARYWNIVDKLGLLQETLHLKLKELFPKIDIPNPIYLSCFYWRQGAHYFKTKVDSRKIIKNIIKPFSTKEIYICNEAYSMNQAWVEGSLTSAKNCIEKILNV